ncbi:MULTISPECIES: hypothetical protein [unclassified Curtobacterium]|uniref:hypothetical protein n=1 Tax=unclassified Curtobacterium TaxID=257496 RepID=UPI001E501B20|nr:MULTISPECIES: hypothetical protein [unclassified Curtobacterium]
MIATAITAHTTTCTLFDTLKWLVVPVAAAHTISACSTTRATATTVPSRRASVRHFGRWAMSHAQVTA